MLHTIPKKVIAVGADHTDRGHKIRSALASFLESSGRRVVLLDNNSPDDSYVRIAEEICRTIIMGRLIASQDRSDIPDSAILIDQFGSAMSSVANVFKGITAAVTWGPDVAYEVTRKNNPAVLCIPTQTQGIGVLEEISPDYAIKIVEQWLNTEFLQDIPEKLRPRYILRQKENDRIHVSAIAQVVKQASLFRNLSRR